MEIKRIPAEETWPLRKEVMWPGYPVSFVMLEEDANGLHFGLFDDDDLVSVVSLFVQGERVQFRKFATKKNKQGMGFGSLLLRHVFDQVKGLGTKKLWCNAREDKVSFYEKFGMHATDQRFDKEGITYVLMECIIG
jgi:GNAT superfamily N-acetyltransferase